MKVIKQKYGTLSDGRKAMLYTVSNGKMSFSVTDYGCTLTSILLPAGNGGMTDVLLGFSTFDGYVTGTGSYGAVVGRFANRIGGAKFSLDGKEYKLDINSGTKDCLHGGFLRFEKQLWHSSIVSTKRGDGIRFSRISREFEQGFPGNVRIEVTYTLNDDNELSLKYRAVADKATPINLTNHAYFNLAGKGSILGHRLQMDCNAYLEIDKGLIPTGRLVPVAGTPFDFTAEKTVGADIEKTEKGYDHCFVTSAYKAEAASSFGSADQRPLVRVAVVTDPVSGHSMTVSTDQEGMQFYTANFVEGTVGKNGTVYHNHDALCLETQCFPDSPNKKEFPSCILQPGGKYRALTVYGFSF